MYYIRKDGDNMNLEDVKRYLKDLIKDDMVVGMAIIKDN